MPSPRRRTVGTTHAAFCVAFMLAWPAESGAQHAPKQKDPVAGPAKAESDEQAGEPRVDVDGTQTTEWWAIVPGLSFALHQGAARDEDLPGLPPNLVEGSQATAGMIEVKRRFGPLTVHAAGGFGISTNRTGGPGIQSGVLGSQSAAAVGTLGVSFKLPGNWLIRAGITATRTTDGEVDATIGVSAEKKF